MERVLKWSLNLYFINNSSVIVIIRRSIWQHLIPVFKCPKMGVWYSNFEKSLPWEHPPPPPPNPENKSTPMFDS